MTDTYVLIWSINFSYIMTGQNYLKPMLDTNSINFTTSYNIIPSSGYILAATNAVEMAFLGMALSIRIRKCTGSHMVFRYMSLLAPPAVMLIFTCVGMLLAWQSRPLQSSPII